jgi:hypothetical protein
MSLRIRPKPSTNSELLSAWHDGRLTSVLQVTWALVLRCYTDLGDICFGYQYIDAGEVSPSATNLTTFRLAVGDEDSPHELVKKVEGGAAFNGSPVDEGTNAAPESYLMFNTIVLVRKNDGKSQGLGAASLPPPLASTLPKEVCGSHLVSRV